MDKEEPVVRKKRRKKRPVSVEAAVETIPPVVTTVAIVEDPPVKPDMRRKENMTPEQREAKRANWQRLLAEGKVGPQFGVLGRRTRNLRASELIAIEAQRHAHKILRALLDGLKPSMPISIRLKAAEQFIRIEQQEAELLMAEEKHELAKLTPEEISHRIAEIALELGLIQQNDAGSIDGDAVEFAEGAIAASSSTDDANQRETRGARATN